MAIINGQTFWDFDPTEDVVSDRQNVTAGVWSGGSGNLITIYTSSTQKAASGEYYNDVYNVPITSTTTIPEIQFSIAYGHKYGSGSSKLNEQYPSRAIYSQYKNILLEPTDEFFTIGGVNKRHIMVVNFGLSRIKQTLDPGDWQFTLASTLGSKFTTLIDDSGQSVNFTTTKAGRKYNIISGSIAGGAYSTTITYGLAYPDMGILILDPDQLSGSTAAFTGVVCNVSSSNVASVNISNFFNAMSASMTSSNGFIARNLENIASTHYFVRVKNAAFNFSNNPTFVTGTLGDFYNQDMINNPTTYFTTIGLYNGNNELLAVAKVSQPLKKSPNNEALVRVKLDY